MSKDESIGWMYEGAKGSTHREDYLLGKKVDKNFEKYSDVVNTQKAETIDTIVSTRAVFNSGQSTGVKTSSLQKDIIKSEDPFVAVKVREETKRRELMDNPLMKMRLQNMLKTMMTSKNEKKKDKKVKKDKKKKKKKRSRSSSSSSSDDDVQRSKKNKRSPSPKRKRRMSGRSPESKYVRGRDINSGRGENSKVRHRSRSRSVERSRRNQRSRSRSIEKIRRRHQSRSRSIEKNRKEGERGRSRSFDKSRNSRLNSRSPKHNPSRSRNSERNPSSKHHSRSRSPDRTRRGSTSQRQHRAGSVERNRLSPKRSREEFRKSRSRSRSSDQPSSSNKNGSRKFNSHIPRHLQRRHDSSSDSESDHKSQRKQKGSDEEKDDARKKSYGLVEMRKRTSEEREEEAKAPIKEYKLIKIPTGRGGNNITKQREARKALTDEEKAARLAEMEANVKWREEIRETNVAKKRIEDEEEKEEADKTGYAPSFIRSQMREACDDMTVEKRLQSNKRGVQRSHGYMDRSFAKK
uniref:Sex determining protein MOG-3 n=1 Tax=Caenorhabditis remanei TaxID=31234 RepID=Q155W5_CAERE|nr:sex determining protein MOG-3 [Caenorhabditis remanei]